MTIMIRIIIIILVIVRYRGKCAIETVDESYKIFSASTYFAEISEIFKQSIIHSVNKFQYSVKYINIIYYNIIILNTNYRCKTAIHTVD